MSTLLDNLSNYMFSKKNIIEYNSIITNTNKTNVQRVNEKRPMNKKVFDYNSMNDENNMNNKNNINDENSLIKKVISKYEPKQTDSLFWCFYILKYGYSEYEKNSLHNTFYIEKQEKLKLAEKMQDKNVKEIIKTYKIKPLTDIINNLVNDNLITVKTFFALCAIEKKNVIIIEGHKYLDFESNNDMNANEIIVIHRNKKSLEHHIELNVSTDILTNYRETYYHLDGCKENKIKNISSYTIAELMDICKKLDINLELNDTQKLTKKIIYERLVQNYN